MKRFLQELGLKQNEYVAFYDSQSAINLDKDSMYHSHMKTHRSEIPLVVVYYRGELLVLNKIHTDKNAADMLTKAIPSGNF